MGPFEHDWQFNIVEQETHGLGADIFIKTLLTDKSKVYPETHELQTGPSLHVWQLGIAQETHIFVTVDRSLKNPALHTEQIGPSVQVWQF